MIPVYLTMPQVAKILGWRTRRAYRWLKRQGAAVERGGQWVTTPELLRESFPEIYERWLMSDDDT